MSFLRLLAKCVSRNLTTAQRILLFVRLQVSATSAVNLSSFGKLWCCRDCTMLRERETSELIKPFRVARIVQKFYN